MVWNSTHRDVHLQAIGYDVIWERTVDDATAMKQHASSSRVFEPVTLGYCDLFGSAFDHCVDGADRAAHGSMPFVKWYLHKVCAHEQQTDVRCVDYLDLHFYRHGCGIIYCNVPPADSESAGIAVRRLAALKELHDPRWISPSWIVDPGNNALFHYARAHLIRPAR
ncbi:MAG: glycoside hydrolase family 44 protein, partial [Dokdonella sp.]